MPLLARRIIFFAFVVFFAIGAVLLLFFANGYRYNSAKNAVEKTGQVVVLLKHGDVSLFLNGQRIDPRRVQSQLSFQTPAHSLDSILPGTYRLRIERDGYFAWEKTIAVHSGQSTIVRDIVMVSSGGASIDTFPLDADARILGASGNYLILAEGTKAVRTNGRERSIVKESSTPIVSIEQVYPPAVPRGESALETWVRSSAPGIVGAAQTGEQTLTAWTPFEIWEYAADGSAVRRQLITRVSREIAQVVSLKGLLTVVRYDDGGVELIDRTDGELRIYPIDENVRSVTVFDNGTFAFERAQPSRRIDIVRLTE